MTLQNFYCSYGVLLLLLFQSKLVYTLPGSWKPWIEAFGKLLMVLLGGVMLFIMIPDPAELDEYTKVGFAHGDLDAHNIMINDNFHLTG